MKYFLVYKFACASCSSSYIGETCHHFKTRIEKHIKKDNKSHIFKHLHSTTTCLGSYNSLCFKIIDTANSKFDFKIKEALQISWRKPNLNVQQNNLALTLSLELLSPHVLFCLCLFVCFFVSLSSFIFIISDNNCWHLLLSWLHFAITSSCYKHLALYLSFIYCFHYLYANYGIFDCLNYNLLLLHLILTYLVIDSIINM